MATGTIILSAAAAHLDGTNTPAVGFANSLRHLLFDDGGNNAGETCYWTFRMPQNFSSGLTAKVQYSMDSATSGTVEWEASLWAVSDGDAESLVGAVGYATANSGSATVPGTAEYLDEISITMTNADSVAAGDWCSFRLARDGDDATNDTATGDARVWSVALEYTTT